MYTMKISLSSLVVAALAASTQASPTPVIRDISADQIIQKRASITEACNIGYCTQNGGTTGGAGGTTTTVSTLPQLTAAAKADGKAVIIVQGTLSGNAKVKVSSHKTLIGAPGSSLTGIGFQIWKQSNVIVRNMKISKVLAENGDAITIQASSNVWVDHCDLSSDMDHGKDYYDGLCDISHGADWITISNTHFHDHYKASLVGHSDKNGGEDQSHFHVTYANNYWSNINSRTPLARFGTVHIYNTYWNGLDTGVNTRMGAQVLVQSSVFENTKQAIFFAYSSETGYAVVQDVDLGGSTNTAPQGTLTSVPYQYSLLGSSKVKASVTANVGQRLTF